MNLYKMAYSIIEWEEKYELVLKSLMNDVIYE